MRRMNRYMRHSFLAIVTGGLLLWFCAAFSACTGKGKSEITAEMIQNPATPDGVDERVAKPVLSFEEKEHDFGELKEGEKVSYTYHFTNTGNASLIISSVVPGCGCTVADFTRTPVPPQKEGKVTITFDTKDKQGMVRKSVRVQANTYPAETVLFLTANIEKP